MKPTTKSALLGWGVMILIGFGIAASIYIGVWAGRTAAYNERELSKLHRFTYDHATKAIIDFQDLQLSINRLRNRLDTLEKTVMPRTWVGRVEDDLDELEERIEKLEPEKPPNPAPSHYYGLKPGSKGGIP